MCVNSYNNPGKQVALIPILQMREKLGFNGLEAVTSDRILLLVSDKSGRLNVLPHICLAPDLVLLLLLQMASSGVWKIANNNYISF